VPCHVSKKGARYDVKHIERYISDHKGLRLRDHKEHELTLYLDVLGRKANMKDWQFFQAVNVLPILFVNLLKLGWV